MCEFIHISRLSLRKIKEGNVKFLFYLEKYT